MIFSTTKKKKGKKEINIEKEKTRREKDVKFIITRSAELEPLLQNTKYSVMCTFKKKKYIYIYIYII